MRLGLVLGYGDAFGVESRPGFWGEPPPPPPALQAIPCQPPQRRGNTGSRSRNSTETRCDCSLLGPFVGATPHPPRQYPQNNAFMCAGALLRCDASPEITGRMRLVRGRLGVEVEMETKFDGPGAGGGLGAGGGCMVDTRGIQHQIAPPPPPRDSLEGGGGGTPLFQGAQPMPSHYLPDGKCQAQWHL